MTPDDLAAIRRMSIDFDADALAVEVHRLRVERVALAAKNGEVGMALVEALAEVDRLAYFERAWRDDFAEVIKDERARILAAVTWMDKERCYTNGVHEDWHLRLAAVIAAIEGET